MEHLSNDHEDRPNQHKNSHKLCDEMGHPAVNWQKVNGNWDNNMIRISQWKAIVQQIIPSKERNKPNRTVCITVWGLSRKINHLSKVVWDYKNYNRVHHIYQFQQNRLTSPHDGQKHTSRCIDQENPIYVRWNRTKNSAYIQRRWLTEENKIRCCVK